MEQRLGLDSTKTEMLEQKKTNSKTPVGPTKDRGI